MRKAPGFWDSVVEIQAVVLPPVFSQHPTPLHVGLSMPLVAFVGRMKNLQRMSSLSLHPLGSGALL